MRHWQILKREDGINSKCQNCIHFFSEESGEADCDKWIEPEWNDDQECWECERFRDAEEAEQEAWDREEDRQVQLAVDEWKGIRD